MARPNTLARYRLADHNARWQQGRHDHLQGLLDRAVIQEDLPELRASVTNYATTTKQKTKQKNQQAEDDTREQHPGDEPNESSSSALS